MFFLIVTAAVFFGCMSANQNAGMMAKYAFPEVEEAWIRNGEPIEFEGRQWYPQARYDLLLDSEMFLQGEYRGVPFFTEKIDVRPYSKVFTKFGRNKFRVYRTME